MENANYWFDTSFSLPHTGRQSTFPLIPEREERKGARDDVVKAAEGNCIQYSDFRRGKKKKKK